jgi:hypothetical protein
MWRQIELPYSRYGMASLRSRIDIERIEVQYNTRHNHDGEIYELGDRRIFPKSLSGKSITGDFCQNDGAYKRDECIELRGRSCTSVEVEQEDRAACSHGNKKSTKTLPHHSAMFRSQVTRPAGIEKLRCCRSVLLRGVRTHYPR